MTGALRIRVELPRPGFALSADLELPGHGISVLFGPSGAGKTTLLRFVAGLEPAARGLVSIAGDVWQDDAAGVRLPTWRRSLGYVFQEASLFEHLDVRRNLEYGLRRSGQAAGEAWRAAVDLLGIGHLLDRSTRHLSGGERQRVAIARALATRPRLLLLDEPLASLDLARRQEILPWLEKLRDELSIPMLYVSHSSGEVARLADHMVLLDAGRVRAAGPAAQVLSGIENPVVVGDDVGTLVFARVAERDAPWQLVRAAFDDGSFWIADQGRPVGAPVRLHVLARDVSIQLEEPSRTSIQNHLRAVVESFGEGQQPSQALVRLRCGRALLQARVTRRSVHDLGLEPGTPVWAQVKSVAVIG